MAPHFPAGRRSVSGPTTIDRYQLVSRLGKGGMAEVYRARLISIGGFERDVALKVLLPSYASEPEFVEMLLDEARIAGAIDHPNVLKVLDVGRRGDLFYLVMEYVDGRDLRTIAKNIPGARIPLGMALYVVSEMLRGLSAVHEAVDERGKPRNVVHRDISPGNVLVDRRGFVKLGDFGIARASGRITRTRVGAIKGKSRYMAPEQLAGAPVDHRADLYSVGVTLFEAIFGDFARQSCRPTIYGPMFTWPDRMPANAVPPEVEQVLRRSIAENPAARYHSAAEMRADLELAIYRAANGYGPDVLARELRRILGDAPAPAMVPVSGRIPYADTASGVEGGFVLEPVGRQGPATLDGARVRDVSGDFTPIQSASLSGLSLHEVSTGVRLRRPSWLSRRWTAGLLVAAMALATIGIAVAVAGTGNSAPPVPVEEVHAPHPQPAPLQPRTTPLPSP
jgi:serine/threonine-protein kinase